MRATTTVTRAKEARKKYLRQWKFISFAGTETDFLAKGKVSPVGSPVFPFSPIFNLAHLTL